jgi:hypothetical protein
MTETRCQILRLPRRALTPGIRLARAITSVAWLLLPPAPGSAQVRTVGTFSVQILDETAHPIPGVLIEAELAGKVVSTATSDAEGRALIRCPVPQPCTVTATVIGYQQTQVQIGQEQSSDSAMQIQLTKVVQHSETVTVHADSESPLATSESSVSKLPVAAAMVSPLRPATLLDALPLVPGVIRTPDGRVKIAGLDEQHSALIINSVDVTDPATGNFGLSVPIDSVDTVKVMQSPYLAQYGNFTAGVVRAETRRGGDQWAYALNDPLPEVRIRSGHLVGLRAATPRFNLSGPLIRNRLYFLEGAEYLMHKDQVRTVPFPVNETKSTAVNSFTQFDGVLTAKQTMAATLHFAPRTIQYVNLNFFDPQAVTPNLNEHEDTGTVTHRVEMAGGLFASTLAVTRVASEAGPQSPGEMTLSPVGDSGSYFGQQSRQATRFQWLETWTPAAVLWHGQHMLQAGLVLGHAENEGDLSGRTVHLTDSSGHLLQNITYAGPGSYHLSDVEPAVYAQDHWIIATHFAVDAGLRWETQTITYTTRAAPRAGFAWTPTKDVQSTIIRGGMGVFYDQVPLNTYAFRSFPRQTVTTYDGLGNITDGPRVFYNLTNTEPNSNFALIDQESHSGNFAPYSLAWNLEAEQRIRSAATVRVRYLQNDASNQLTLQSQITPDRSALVLGGSGSAHTKQLDITTAVGSSPERRAYFSYVRQLSRGTLTDVASYLGDARYPVVRSMQEASTAGEIPDRFLLWGTSTLPWRMRISPHVEYRDGFPYQPVNELQQYVSLASYTQPRYPRYFALDMRLSKDINVGPKHAVRLSLNGLNLTNHSNFLQVHSNIADPQYRTFFGNYGRHLLVDFDFLF